MKIGRIEIKILPKKKTVKDMIPQYLAAVEKHVQQEKTEYRFLSTKTDKNHERINDSDKRIKAIEETLKTMTKVLDQLTK